MKPDAFTQSVRPTVLSNKNFNKIFCIGFNKTGTTTLEKTLALYGYALPKQAEQEARLVRQVAATDYTEFATFVEKYDAFQDLPFSQGMTYVAADALFPNSKFILTVREPKAWFQSLLKFHKKITGLPDMSKATEQDIKDKFSYLYSGYAHEKATRLLTTFDSEGRKILWDKLYDEAFYTKIYEERNQQIQKYFADAPEKLLIIDVTKEKTTQKICAFLNIPETLSMLMPHANKT